MPSNLICKANIVPLNHAHRISFVVVVVVVFVVVVVVVVYF